MSENKALDALQVRMTTMQGAPAGAAPIGENMTGWTCKLQHAGREMTVPFWMGSGHKGAEPKKADVLHAILLDASAAEGTFEDFCFNLGYDTDSRRAEHTYNVCKQLEKALRGLFGDRYEEAQQAMQDH